MRNLITLNSGKLVPTASLAAELDQPFELIDSIFDTLTDSITCVLADMSLGQLEVQQFMKDGTKNVLASFSIQTFDDKILSFAHFADYNQLVFVLRSGDIITATYDAQTYDPQMTVVEIVGSIETGLEAAAWSPDEETLAMFTTEKTIVLLSKMFEPISEYTLVDEDLKMSKHVNVGWGKKETQFRGKGVRAMEREALASLKASGLVGNELRDPTMPYAVDSGIISDLDNREISISWRGDCEYFVVSSIETVSDPSEDSNNLERRVLRVFTRDGALDSASEPVDYMENNLSWKPQGSLIASIQRKDFNTEEESLELIFFERNGLRHGEFSTRLPPNEKVRQLCWNNNSEVLTIVLNDRIQLWTTKNYHWYLKQEIYGENIQFAKWHPEKDFSLMYGNSNSLNIVDFAFKMIQGPTLEPFDNGTTLVIDGNTINITPLAVANVPPPMSFRDFETPSNVIDAAVNLCNEVYAALNKDFVYIASVSSFEDMKKGKHPDIKCEYSKLEFANENDTLRQVAFINDSVIAVLFDSNNVSNIALIEVQDASQPLVINVIPIMGKVVLIRSSFDYNHLVYETRDGTVMQLDFEGNSEIITKFPQLSRDFRVKRVHNSQSLDDNQWSTSSSELVAFGLTSNGKLYANDVLISSAVTSIEITDSMLLFTTAHHNLQFVHLNSTSFKPLPLVENNIIDERIRAIERGSILVSVIPSKSAVVLQASRGNLETIYPRIMVLSEVRKDILAKKYKDAFICCRTNRINLDILHDYDPELFYQNLELFINQIEKVDYLDLFISCLIEEDVTKTKYKETLSLSIDEAYEVAPPPPTEMQLYMKKKMFDPSTSKVNKICKAMLEVLLSKPEYKKKYLQSILTAYASQNPLQLEDALKLISGLEDADEKDNSVTYLCFLQDVNLVYKVALSLYDIKLSLSIAQKSQMDPREYLPFLQNLFEQEPLRCQFIIDDYLKNFEKALRDLIEINKDGATVSDELIEYIKAHDLYKPALAEYRHNTEKQNYIYAIFAKSLSSQQEYIEAGIIYEMLGDYKEALNAYVLGKKWREALTLATQHFPSLVDETANDLISSLSFDHKYVDVAEIYLQFLDNVEESMTNYCKAYHYDTATLIAAKYNRIELIEKVVDSGLGDGFAVVAELLADCKGQVNSQLKRLRDLRTKKEEDPYSFYGEETEQADDVSIAPSETSTKESFFTRYTGKTSGTAKTGASRRSSKNKRREERKRARGKKGTIYEEEYLVKSIGRLIERVEQTTPDAVRLIAGLCRRNMREQAYQIQKNVVELLDMLKKNVVEIYTISEKDRERVNDNGEIYYLPEIPAPEIKDFPKNKTIDY
ncbi:hypothetical protein Kpol_483p13 [Vanderwaltozyma polyspora DSM 70294]|uniref:Elongator complex protein 1 n=1 Tax=Vanderwaltozyma polyspora (strain ATCC 22028 / DSM 70294 / BCRC 21397 / CBS 2163 / NBRC 10782 / NRRL Y-8283 / UCD 57-17) TaxID=436907 RepID=A7TQ65_VANPO|nr:uncharacterized protein Kpol_483p13 [Vanderwaltozyma polyspora DSM 70294]EDO15594.1 hypothetical protein Kpol_483p13 [Vanderwaltozyma polyspora DSM 70294]